MNKISLLNFINQLTDISVSNDKCPKNKKIKKRWLLPDKGYYGNHEFEIINIERWGSYDWYKYEVYFECKHCGARTKKFGIKEKTLIEYGIDIDKYFNKKG